MRILKANLTTYLNQDGHVHLQLTWDGKLYGWFYTDIKLWVKRNK